MTRVIHAITPGDHYSPRTGSAIPTVVHGLAGAANEDHRQPSYPQYVVLGAETYRPRYDSASAIEFLDVPGPSRNERLIDAALAPFGRPRRSAARYFQPLADALLDLEPAIVLAHNAPILPWLLRKSSHSVILYAHNDILRTLTRREAARTLGSVASIVCVSESLRAQTRIRLPRELRDRVVVVGNGVDCAQFAPSAPSASTGLRGSKLRVIFVGRMIAEKGPDILLQAAALLRRDDIEIMMVGSHGFDPNASLTPYEERLRDLARGCGMSVSFRPFVPRAELPDLLRSADIMVVPSRWQEPSGLTVGEALATGLPVIAHRVGGIPEVVGSAGILIESERPESLANEIARLADDGALREQLSVAARSRAKSHDWNWAWSTLKLILDEARTDVVSK